MKFYSSYLEFMYKPLMILYPIANF